MMTEETRRIRVGMVGGGPGAGIAETHRTAMRLDDKCVLIAGVFSRDSEKSRTAARLLRIDLDRVYPDYGVMAEMESKLESDRIDVAVIVTRTNSHFEIAKKFLQSGIHVICDKPLCLSLREAKELKRLAEEKELILCLTHNYSGYAMVRHAARMVRNGDLGKVCVVQAEHASGWAAKLLEKQGHSQAAWRTDPVLSGDASVLFDLGTHAHQLARFVTGLEVTEVAAEMSQIVQGRAIKDNANLLLRFSNGARVTLWASMAAIGNEHGLPQQILAQGADGLSAEAKRWTRAGLGHPEGFFESFANIYTEVAEAILAKSEGRPYTKAELGFPDASDGARGVAFVESAMRSFASGSVWTGVEAI